MNQFIFETRQKTLFGIMMLIGVISMLITFIGDDQWHTRFWSNFLHNSVFFTGISLMALFMIAAKITAWAGWYTVFKRLWEAFSLFLIPGFILMMIISLGLWTGWHHIYEWSDKAVVAADPVLIGKSAFLNKGWYTFGGIIIMGGWIFFATKLRSLSVDEDTNGDTTFTHARKMRIWAAPTLPFIGFSSAAMIWLWIMSVDAHWYSTLFAWWTSVSVMVAMVAMTIILLITLKIRGYFPLVTIEHLHDLGKYMFAFSIFWTYMWFSQFMLIWYGNIPEETVYYHTRLHHFPVIFYLNIVCNFVIPFIVLLRNDTKRKYGTLMFISCLLVFTHWINFFLMLKPGILHTAHPELTSAPGFTMPGFLEIGTFIGFLGLFFYFVFSRLTKASLLPRRDPYVMESASHHT